MAKNGQNGLSFYDPEFHPELSLSNDLKKAASTLGKRAIRYMVQAYYLHQEIRKATENQFAELEARGEPHEIFSWLVGGENKLERQIARALAAYAANNPICQWMAQIKGIGPILATGLVAHIDITKAPTVGNIYSFAGIAGDDQKPWEEGGLRPWNPDFKTLCFKVGDSFVKLSNDPECWYGQLYREWKAEEVAKNEAGLHHERAAQEMTRAKRRRLRRTVKGKEYDTSYSYNVRGLLSPQHVDNRARRRVIKRFLSDLHKAMYIHHYGIEPPRPYAIEHMGHAHTIECPYPMPPVRAKIQRPGAAMRDEKNHPERASHEPRSARRTIRGERATPREMNQVARASHAPRAEPNEKSEPQPLSPRRTRKGERAMHGETNQASRASEP